MSANTEQVLEQLWVREAHDRLDAYDRGELEAVSAEEVFEELTKERLIMRSLTAHPTSNRGLSLRSRRQA
jgi:type II secretory pathway component PulF